MAVWDTWTDEMLDAAEEQIIFFRTHLDIYIECAYAPIKLTRNQHIVARAIGNSSTVHHIASRGAGKTFLGGLIASALADLYPGSDQIVLSNTIRQAVLMLEKIKQLSEQNENLANEMKRKAGKYVSLSKAEASCEFKNGSTIRAVPLDSARGLRGKVLWQDESLQVDQELYTQIAEPIKNTRRIVSTTHGFKDFPSKTICMTSACTKSNPYYEIFLQSVRAMKNGDYSNFACAFDYKAAASNGITDIEFFESERKRMPQESFMMEYGSIFLGGNADSALPYALVDSCRTLEKIEMFQPKSSKSRYVMGLDLATSDAKGSDNTILSVIKFVEKSDGSFAKKLVYLRSWNGKKLEYIAEEVRKIYHLCFPNTEKICLDCRGLGDSAPAFFDKEWIDPISGKEYPPLVVDDEPNVNPVAVQLLHPVRAVLQLNQRMYTNLRVCLEQRTLELPISSKVVREKQNDIEDMTKRMPLEMMAVYQEADAFQYECGNIVSKVTASGNVTYDTTNPHAHKDRYSSVTYALDYVCEIEKESVKRHRHGGVCVGICSDLLPSYAV